MQNKSDVPFLSTYQPTMSDFRPIMLNLPTYLKSDVINGRSPFEIWSKIFGHLDFKMQNLATLVCKTWLEMIRNDFVFSGELSLNSITKMEASEINSIISKCPLGVIVWTKIPTEKLPRFLPKPLRRGQIKNFIKPIMLNNP